MPDLTRRALLAGSAGLLALPRRALARSDADRRLRELLDGAAQDREAALTALGRIDPATLSPATRIDWASARSGLAIDVELARRFPFGRLGRSPYVVTPTSGAWSRRDAGAEAILAETRQIAADAARGVRLPRELIGRTIAALDSAVAAAQGPRAAALAAQRDLLRSQAGEAPPAGVSALPDGRRYYALLLRRLVGDDADVEVLRRRLEAEQARTLARADQLFRSIGQRTGGVGARYAAMWRDPRWLYPDDDAGRDRAVAAMNAVLDRARAGLDGAFGPLPPAVRQVAVQRMAAADEAAGRQGYRLLPQGGQPGAYVVDLREIRRRPAWTLPAVVHHELLPGHMVQLPIELLADPHPLRIDYAQAFPEGWAIYAEQLAADRGAFHGDPRGALGQCHWRLFRIARARADLGLHLDGWSPEAARAYWRETMGEPAYFAPFAADVDRILIEPASRAAEAAVALALADGARGRRLPDYHRLVLDHGRVRTDLLRTMLADAR